MQKARKEKHGNVHLKTKPKRNINTKSGRTEEGVKKEKKQKKEMRQKYRNERKKRRKRQRKE